MRDERERTHMVDGPVPDHVHPMPPVVVHQGATHYHDYWAAVTDVPCPCCGAGRIRSAEANHVPGYRICDGCYRYYYAGGDAESPTLIEDVR